MQSRNVVTALTIGAIALLMIPKTRKIIYSAACSIADALNGIADKAIDATEKGSEELNKFSNKVQDVATSIKESKQSWQ